MLKRLDTQQATALQSVELFKFLFFSKKEVKMTKLKFDVFQM